MAVEKKSLYDKKVFIVIVNKLFSQLFFNCHPTDLQPVEVQEFLKAKKFFVGLFVPIG